MNEKDVRFAERYGRPMGKRAKAEPITLGPEASQALRSRLFGDPTYPIADLRDRLDRLTQERAFKLNDRVPVELRPKLTPLVACLASELAAQEARLEILEADRRFLVEALSGDLDTWATFRARMRSQLGLE